jgi:hypothetical protein
MKNSNPMASPVDISVKMSDLVLKSLQLESPYREVVGALLDLMCAILHLLLVSCQDTRKPLIWSLFILTID